MAAARRIGRGALCQGRALRHILPSGTNTGIFGAERGRAPFPTGVIIMNETKIALIGGDARQTVTAAHLCDVGFEVAGFGFGGWGGEMNGITRCEELDSALRGARAVIAPLPISRDTETLYCPLGSAPRAGDQPRRLYILAARGQRSHRRKPAREHCGGCRRTRGTCARFFQA